MKWLAPSFVAVIALVMFLRRRELARFQGNILGGSILPGCVVAEAIVILLLAAAMLFWA